MPYGISKKLGGDSPSNDARMEKQVKALEGRGFGKVSAIKIAKAQMAKGHHSPYHHAQRVLKGKR